METNNNKKPFYKNKWLWIVLAIIAVPLWPFILSFFVGRKIYAGSMGKKLKYSLLTVLALITLIIGPAWASSFGSSESSDAMKAGYEAGQADSTVTDEPVTEPSPEPSTTPSTAPSTQPSAEPNQEQSVSSNPARVMAKVTRVIDGDTIEIEGGQRVRYIGVDTPEVTGTAECFGIQASNKNKELVLNKNVELEKDVSETDRYGRLLRYVYIDGAMVNESLVREGFANASTYPPDVKHQSLFRTAEQEARNNNKGLWSACNQTSTPTSSTNTGNTAPAPVAPADTGSCNIKGNISSSDEKIYHVPGCQSYNQTVINTSDGERMFCSEQEAVAAGWRKAKNCP